MEKKNINQLHFIQLISIRVHISAIPFLAQPTDRQFNSLACTLAIAVTWLSFPQALVACPSIQPVYQVKIFQQTLCEQQVECLNCNKDITTLICIIPTFPIYMHNTFHNGFHYKLCCMTNKINSYLMSQFVFIPDRFVFLKKAQQAFAVIGLLTTLLFKKIKNAFPIQHSSN